MNYQKYRKLLIITLTLTFMLGGAFWTWDRFYGNRSIIIGPPWLLYSDEELLDKFEYDALYGKQNVVSYNQILYERFYFARRDFTKAKPFLEIAAELGDDTAREILKDPRKAYIELKERLGEYVPHDFHLK
jgi:hypothetical protein